MSGGDKDRQDSQYPDEHIAAVEAYLLDTLDPGDVIYRHSKDLAPHLDLSPHYIGPLLPAVDAVSEQLDIRSWSRSPATTWQIKRRRESDE